MPQIDGTEGPDTLPGTSGDDQVSALGGNDVIELSTGHDSVDGGAEIDDLRGSTDAGLAGLPAGPRTYTITDDHISDGSGMLDTTFTGIEVVIVEDQSGYDVTVDASAFTGRNVLFHLGSGNHTFNGGPGDTGLNLLAGRGSVDGGAGYDDVRAFFDTSAASPLRIFDSGGFTLFEQDGVQIMSAINVESILVSGVYSGGGAPTHALFVDASDSAADLYFTGTGFADEIVGGSGDNYFRLFAGGGYQLTGAAGSDTFDFYSSVALDQGTILDLDEDDLIRLGTTMTFIGGGSFTGVAGEYRTFALDNQALIVADADGDGDGDYTLTIANGGFGLEETAPGSNTLRIAGVVAYGDAGPNMLTGTAGNDSLDGEGGADTMTGLGGNDWYRVDDGGDVVSEAANGGFDVILAEVSYTLGAGVHVEQLSAYPPPAVTPIDLTGNELDNIIIGTDGVNVLTGGDGADNLTGLGGDDTLLGGPGDDTYLVDADGDEVIEAEGQGSDRVQALVTYFLGAGAEVELLEYVTLSSTLAINLGGSDFANTLYGNAGTNFLYGLGGSDALWGFAGSDYLVGGTGADMLWGGLGDDTYYVDQAGDLIYELAGEGSDRLSAAVSYTLHEDSEIELLETSALAGTGAIDLGGSNLANTIYGNNGANFLYGYAGNDWLWGFGADDYLIGGTGADVMYGGLGNDTYYVDSTADLIYELELQGNDRVAAEISVTLPDNADIEVLEAVNLTATDAMDLGGSDTANVIRGNAGANVIHGHGGGDAMWGFGGDDFLAGDAGGDYMVGGTGNDTYYLDEIGDTVREFAGEGDADRVATAIGYALGSDASIELFETTDDAGTAALALTGSDLANTIRGNAGANTLDGRGGADVLWGLGGADTFAFTTPLGAGNVDAIADFQVGSDKLALENAVFTYYNPGSLDPATFRIGSAAQDADDFVIYDSTSGALYYDADGNGAGAAVQFAALASGLGLTAGDFLVI